MGLKLKKKIKYMNTQLERISEYKRKLQGALMDIRGLQAYIPVLMAT